MLSTDDPPTPPAETDTAEDSSPSDSQPSDSQPAARASAPRRRFLLQLLSGGTLGLAGAAVALAELTGGSRRPPVALLGNLDQLPRGTARGFVREGIVLVHRADGELAALSTRCTHLGCRVALVGDELRCPCHQGRYDLAGRVLGGPPKAPLERHRLLVTVDQRVYYYPDQHAAPQVVARHRG